MATTVAATGQPTIRPTGRFGATGKYNDHAFLPVAASVGILVGDLIVDTGVFASGSNSSTPPAAATGFAQTVSGITYTGNTYTQTFTNATSAAALQLAVHDAFYGVSETYRDYALTTSGTIRDFCSVATTGEFLMNVIPTVLDGSSYTGQGTAATVGQLVAVAVTAVNGSNYFVALDGNNLPYVEIVPWATQASGAGLKVSIGQVSRPFSATDTQVYVKIASTLTGGQLPQLIVA